MAHSLDVMLILGFFSTKKRDILFGKEFTFYLLLDGLLYNQKCAEMKVGWPGNENYEPYSYY